MKKPGAILSKSAKASKTPLMVVSDDNMEATVICANEETGGWMIGNDEDPLTSSIKCIRLYTS